MSESPKYTSSGATACLYRNSYPGAMRPSSMSSSTMSGISCGSHMSLLLAASLPFPTAAPVAAVPEPCPPPPMAPGWRAGADLLGAWCGYGQAHRRVSPSTPSQADDSTRRVSNAHDTPAFTPRGTARLFASDGMSRASLGHLLRRFPYVDAVRCAHLKAFAFIRGRREEVRKRRHIADVHRAPLRVPPDPPLRRLTSVSVVGRGPGGWRGGGEGRRGENFPEK